MMKTPVLALSVLALGATACTTYTYPPTSGGRQGGGQYAGGGSFTRLHNNTTGEEFCRDDRTGEIFRCPSSLPPMRR